MITICRNLWCHRNLLSHFIYREVVTRYKGSYLGIVWTLVQPLVMLAIYSYVFTVIFKAKWGSPHGVSNLDYTMAIFTGLIVFQIFSESMFRSSTILSSNANFVKRVVFPLEILPTSAVFGVVVLNLFSVVVLIGALIWFRYPLDWHFLLFPVVILPAVLITLGMSYIVTTLGAFFKDVAQAIGLVMNVLFYLTPVFYPVSSVPKKFQPYMIINPFTSIIEAFRDITLYHRMPSWLNVGLVYLIAMAIFLVGAVIFTKSKEFFSDVI